MRTKNKKLIFVLAIILSFVIGLGASALMNAEDVLFDNTGTKIKSGNVQGAIEELDKRYKTDTSNTCSVPSEPNLNNNLIPVTIADDGTVTYADINTKWYDYCNKEWANAVMLVSSPTKTYQVNDTILESDIKAYFVWIPKYKYKLWNVNTTNAVKGMHSIDIVFDTENTIDVEGISCVTPMTSNYTGTCDNGEYMTHPAFISMNVNGFWMGKFSITGTINAITVKPGLTALRNQTVKALFESMYNYSRENNSHMMKNTEWGAVAYLSHSKYGINYKININNNSDYITGCSALTSTDQHSYPGSYGTTSSYFSPYNTEIGYLASTTGNISGIYDMSGGAWEYMAAYRSGTFSSSGFTASTLGTYDSKYYDVYPGNSSISTSSYKILGDASGELGPTIQKQIGSEKFYVSTWYSNHANVVDSTYSWVIRGCNYSYGVAAGQFSFGRDSGKASTLYSSRMVLSP